MKRLQKNVNFKICCRWMILFILIAAVFFLYQNILGKAYKSGVISWIGYLQDGTDMKTAVFKAPDKEYYSRGVQVMQDAGYEETGKEYLRQTITAYGRPFFLAGIFFICIAGAVCEIYANRKNEQRISALIEQECNAVYTQIQDEKEFVRAERQRMGTYMENISHQLKTPITGIMLNLEYLLDTEQDQEKKERLEGCVKQLSWMSEMTIVLLRLAQIDSGKIWMKRKRENLTLLVEDCIDRIVFLSEEKNISILKELCKNCILSCDAFWIKEAVENILKNAIEVTPQNGIIRVSLNQMMGFYEIRIFNSGKKLDKEYQELVFERFYQAENGKTGGFGIGLHLAREIARLHQGTLKVLDTDEQGTTFQFMIPKVIAKDHSR